MKKNYKFFHLAVFTKATIVAVLFSSPASAATITAASCAQAAVQTAINSASNGDIVIIPNGSCTWTSGISLSKQIILSGQTKGSVLITHGAGSGTLLSITTGSTFSTEVKNINFLIGSASGGKYMLIGGSGKMPIIHNNYFRVSHFVLLHAIAILRNGILLHHNTFESLNPDGAGSGCIQVRDFNGSNSWLTASTMGSADKTGFNNTYIEDNIFKNIYLQAIDVDENARAVIRHNTFNNSAIVCHGADTGEDGARHAEVYNNTFIFTTSPSGGINYPLALNWWWYVRGGTGVFTDNIMPNISSSMWGNKSELTLTIQNLRRNAGPYPCAKTYPVFHQIGQSHNGTSSVTEPFYIWGNTGGGVQEPSLSDYSPNECGANTPTTAQFVQSGRDYIVGTPKPSYTKYAYPHPFVSGITTETYSANYGSSMIVSPNPVKNVLNISGIDLQSKISIYDMRGKLMSQQYAADEMMQVNTDNFPAGMYVIRIINDEKMAMRKFIKE